MNIILSPRSERLQPFTWSVHFPNSTADNTDIGPEYKVCQPHDFVCQHQPPKSVHTVIHPILLLKLIHFSCGVTFSLCGRRPLTFALQEFVDELIKGSWILEEFGHLVEVV